MRYRDQRKVAEEWMDLQKMRRLFGDEARQVVDEFEGRRPEGDDEPVVGESSHPLWQLAPSRLLSGVSVAWSLMRISPDD